MPVLLDLRGGDQGAADYLSLNPAGKVPTVVDRRGAGAPFVLTKSNAIMLWVADQRPGLLLSVDEPGERARALERTFYFITEVIERSRAAFEQRKSGDRDGADHLDQVALEAAEFSEIFLKEAAFMAGDRFSLADRRRGVGAAPRDRPTHRSDRWSDMAARPQSSGQSPPGPSNWPLTRGWQQLGTSCTVACKDLTICDEG
jgi:glutathione S-transferase